MSKFETHPAGKDLPEPRGERRPFDGWVSVPVGGDEHGMMPVRDDAGVGEKTCPLLTSASRPGGETSKDKFQVKCIGQQCAFYMLDVKQYYKIDPSTNKVALIQGSDGNLEPEILEEAAVGMCAITATAKNIQISSDFLYEVPRRITLGVVQGLSNMMSQARAHQQAPLPDANKIIT